MIFNKIPSFYKYVLFILTPDNLKSIRSYIKAILIVGAPQIASVIILHLFNITKISNPYNIWHDIIKCRLLSDILYYFDNIIYIPFAETALALIPVIILKKITSNSAMIALACGLFWGYLHAFSWGTGYMFIAGWPFFCFSLMYCMSKSRKDHTRVWLKASIIHSGINLLGLIIVFLLQYW
jgi:hypothetical protein